MVFGFGGSLEHGDGEQDAHKGEAPQNHDQSHTAAGLIVTVPGPTGSDAAPGSLVRSVVRISKPGELGRHFPPPRATILFKVNQERIGSDSGPDVSQTHYKDPHGQLSLESDRQRSLRL